MALEDTDSDVDWQLNFNPDDGTQEDCYELRLTVADILETEGGLSLLQAVMGCRNAVFTVVMDAAEDDLRCESGRLVTLSWLTDGKSKATILLAGDRPEQCDFDEVYLDFDHISAARLLATGCDTVL